MNANSAGGITKALRLLLGLLSGVVATGPMTVAMVLWHRRLPARDRYPLPPREITHRAVEQVAEPRDVDPAVESALTWLAHFGYGGATGALYAGAARYLPGGPATRGPLFGLVVWSVSYLGLLPGLRVLTPATVHPWRRNALMIGAHLIWGWCLAFTYRVLLGDLARGSTALHHSPQPNRDAAPSSHRDRHGS